MTTGAHARPPTAVLIADSTRMGSQLLAEALRRERFRIVGCASSGDDVSFLLAGSPDVVVLSANLERPGGGLRTVARIAAQGCRAATVILLDEPCDRELVVQAFRAGARGMFSRSLSLAEMGKCIECVAAGQVWASAEHMDYLLSALKRAVMPRFPDDPAAAVLSRREQEVVRHLCDGLTNRDIARALGLSEHTVKNHLFRIYAKLGVEKRAEVIFSLLSRGPATEPSPPTPKLLPGALPPTLPGNLQALQNSLLAQCVLDQSCLPAGADGKNAFSTYTWVLRSERGAVELLHKCRQIREMLGSHLTAEQRKQAELRAAQPWPNRSLVRLNRPAPAAGLPLPLPEPHDS